MHPVSLILHGQVSELPDPKIRPNEAAQPGGSDNNPTLTRKRIIVDNLGLPITPQITELRASLYKARHYKESLPNSVSIGILSQA